MKNDTAGVLPDGWIECSIGEVTVAVSKIDPRTDSDRAIDYIDISGIDNARHVVSSVKQYRLGEAPSRARQIVRTGDVLFSTVRPYLRNIARVPSDYDKQVASTGFSVLRPAKGVCPGFLFYLAVSDELVNAVAGLQYGVSYPAVKDEQVREQRLWLPPAEEQYRIVAKIEELFSELDKGVESLKTARRQLEAYRQSVLKHAFEGKFTAQWREENKDKLETPEQMLARIKRERAVHDRRQLDAWQAAVKEWQEDGKTGPKPPKPRAPANIDGMDAGPPDLPGCWGSLRVDCIADVAGGITKNPARSEFPRKMKYLRVANVYADKILTTDVHEIGVTDVEANKVALKAGDLLVVEGNGSMEQIGRVAMWNRQLPVCGHQNHLIRVRVVDGSDPRFVLLFLLSPQGRGIIVKEASSTSGLHTLSISKVSNLIVPVASPAEERAVVAAIDQKVEGLNRSLEEIDRQLAKSEALRQSILKKAFSGQLVAQDPNDEPASVLLRTIKAKRNLSITERRGLKVTETTV